MKRPIFIATLGSINGIIMGVYLKNSIPFICVSFCLLLAAILLLKIKNKKVIFTYLIALIVFFMITSYLDLRYNKKYIDLNESEINIIGTVISEIEEKQYKKCCKVIVESINNDTKYKGDILILYLKKDVNIKYANKIKLKAVYKEPERERNYHGFNYKNYLKTEKIYGIISCENKEITTIKEENLSIFSILNYKTEKCFENILKKYLPERTANLEIGILLGYSANIDEDIKEAFLNSNITHMLAVSGENTMYVILVIGWICNKKILGIKGQKIISIIMILWFVKLTGSTLSVIRAGITAIVYLLAGLFYRKADVINTISIAILISIIENPFNIFNSGMQLSYAGTISIIIFYNLYETKTKNKIFKYLLDNIILTLSANILIIPIMMYQFNTVSLTFLLSNLLVGPLVGIATIIGFLLIFVSLIFPFIAKILSFPLNILLEIIIKIAEFFSYFKISKIYVVTPSIIEVILMYFTIVHVYIKWKNKSRINKKVLSVVLIILIISNITNINIKKELIVRFVDVGQGDCCLITTPNNKKILIDGGGSESQSYDVGKNILIPYLLDRKINKIDYIIISHFDSDHVGGLLTVMEELKVKKVIISRQGEDSENYKRFKEIVKKNKIRVQIVGKGDHISIEKGVDIDVLWPDKNKLINENILNNNSIVFKLIYKKVTIMFTGDIEQIAEQQILNEYKNRLRILNSTILKVAHHGSKTSSIQAFVKAINPKIALIGVGNGNKFGHPNEEIIERLQSFNADIYRTDKMGEIEVVINRQGKIKIKKLIK